jgi:hypothetical protein
MIQTYNDFSKSNNNVKGASYFGTAREGRKLDLRFSQW